MSIIVSKILELLPARASEQGNVIGLVSVYMSSKKIVIERTRDLIYLKLVATDFSLAPVLVKTPVTQRSPSYSAVSALLMNPLPDRSNYSPLCHTHYLTPDPPLARPQCCSALLQKTQCLEEAEQQAEESVDVPYPPLQIVNSARFFSSLCSLSQSSALTSRI